jgi:branched-chain amino acid transport system substrate-binding protein
MSSIIFKIKASEQNVIQHSGYFPDTALLWKQARLMGVKTKAIMGVGATYCDYPTLDEAVGKGIMNYLMQADNPPCQMIPRKAITPEAGRLVDEYLSRVLKQYGDRDPSTHYTDGCFHTWAVFTRVMPLALKKYGEITADTMRKAFSEVDVPPEEDPRGWGCKFAPQNHEFAGQNLRAVGTLSCSG